MPRVQVNRTLVCIGFFSDIDRDFSGVITVVFVRGHLIAWAETNSFRFDRDFKAISESTESLITLCSVCVCVCVVGDMFDEMLSDASCMCCRSSQAKDGSLRDIFDADSFTRGDAQNLSGSFAERRSLSFHSSALLGIGDHSAFYSRAPDQRQPTSAGAKAAKAEKGPSNHHEQHGQNQLVAQMALALASMLCAQCPSLFVLGGLSCVHLGVT